MPRGRRGAHAKPQERFVRLLFAANDAEANIVSYDITKDGVTVAVLTFPKSAFRLGETVSGVVEVNWRQGRGRVLQVRSHLVLSVFYRS